MLDVRKELFDRAVDESVQGIYKMSVENGKLVFTAVDRLPRIKEYIDDSLGILLSGKRYGFFFDKDFESDLLFSNPAVLCEDGNYYVFNEYRYIPSYVYPVESDYLLEYPESLNECVEVVVNE